MSRRGVVGACASLGAAIGLRGSRALAALLPAAAASIAGPRVRLLTEDGQAPLESSKLAPHRAHVFHYPFEGTPCFLLEVGKRVAGRRVELAAGGAYDWGGGVGPKGSIVAFVAICPHSFVHPTRDLSLIYYAAPGEASAMAQRDEVITCCAHGSSFDPARGAIPVQAPAEAPLAAVLLEWDARSDSLAATGILGRAVFEEFFAAFPERSRRPVEGGVAVTELSRYCRSVLSC